MSSDAPSPLASRLTRVEPREGRRRIEMTVELTNGEGVVVMRGSSRGVVLDAPPERGG